ncbi:something about silencing protein 10 [Bombina bombina]|uniref:something about silencing protein 10 n=1 Tax=Bombina bombina TaxID=8345 RepID=UPI00235ABCD2|nr:something about silencing protein 10 [Bombina bombina]
MGKARRSQRLKKPQVDKDVYDESISKANIPSTKETSSDYFNDEVDNYHEKKFKSLMKEGVEFNSDAEELDSEDEVMPLEIHDDDEEDDDDQQEAYDEDDQQSMGSDLDDRRNDGLPDELAWGQRKKLYYDTDYAEHSKKKGKKSKEEIDAEAEEEEEEAQNIQRRLANALNEEDYGLDFIQAFGVKQTEEKPSEEKIVKDLEKMSEKEKRKLLKTESPELLELIQDLKLKLSEVKNDLEPLLKLVKSGHIPQGKGSNYIQTRYQLYLNYCTNISYYLLLKAKRISIHGHPVIERLVTYRNLINDLGPVDERLSAEIKQLLTNALEDNVSAKECSTKTARNSKKAAVKRPRPESQPDQDSDLDEEAALKYYREMENKLLEKRNRGEENAVEELPSEEMDPDAKRAVTYQMVKNKGLTPKRKKIDRNPRVKHREKFRRAKIRRKGQVREVRREESRYSGELSGIRAGVKKSIKLK